MVVKGKVDERDSKNKGESRMVVRVKLTRSKYDDPGKVDEKSANCER